MSGLLCCAKNIPTYTKVVRTCSCTSSIFDVSIHLRKPVNVTMNLNGKFKKDILCLKTLSVADCEVWYFSY